MSILAKLPEPGVETSRSTDEELEITTVEFENGLVMHHRRMDRPADSKTVLMTGSVVVHIVFAQQDAVQPNRQSDSKLTICVSIPCSWV